MGSRIPQGWVVFVRRVSRTSRPSPARGTSCRGESRCRGEPDWARLRALERDSELNSLSRQTYSLVAYVTRRCGAGRWAASNMRRCAWSLAGLLIAVCVGAAVAGSRRARRRRPDRRHRPQHQWGRQSTRDSAQPCKGTSVQRPQPSKSSSLLTARSANRV